MAQYPQFSPKKRHTSDCSDDTLSVGSYAESPRSVSGNWQLFSQVNGPFLTGPLSDEYAPPTDIRSPRPSIGIDAANLIFPTAAHSAPPPPSPAGNMLYQGPTFNRPQQSAYNPHPQSYQTRGNQYQAPPPRSHVASSTFAVTQPIQNTHQQQSPVPPPQADQSYEYDQTSMQTYDAPVSQDQYDGHQSQDQYNGQQSQSPSYDNYESEQNVVQEQSPEPVHASEYFVSRAEYSTDAPTSDIFPPRLEDTMEEAPMQQDQTNDEYAFASTEQSYDPFPSQEQTNDGYASTSTEQTYGPFSSREQTDNGYASTSTEQKYDPFPSQEQSASEEQTYDPFPSEEQKATAEQTYDRSLPPPHEMTPTIQEDQVLSEATPSVAAEHISNQVASAAASTAMRSASPTQADFDQLTAGMSDTVQRILSRSRKTRSRVEVELICIIQRMESQIKVMGRVTVRIREEQVQTHARLEQAMAQNQELQVQNDELRATVERFEEERQYFEQHVQSLQKQQVEEEKKEDVEEKLEEKPAAPLPEEKIEKPATRRSWRMNVFVALLWSVTILMVYFSTAAIDLSHLSRSSRRALLTNEADLIVHRLAERLQRSGVDMNALSEGQLAAAVHDAAFDGLPSDVTTLDAADAFVDTQVMSEEESVVQIIDDEEEKAPPQRDDAEDVGEDIEDEPTGHVDEPAEERPMEDGDQEHLEETEMEEKESPVQSEETPVEDLVDEEADAQEEVPVEADGQVHVKEEEAGVQKEETPVEDDEVPVEEYTVEETLVEENEEVHAQGDAGVHEEEGPVETGEEAPAEEDFVEEDTADAKEETADAEEETGDVEEKAAVEIDEEPFVEEVEESKEEPLESNQMEEVANREPDAIESNGKKVDEDLEDNNQVEEEEVDGEKIDSEVVDNTAEEVEEVVLEAGGDIALPEDSEFPTKELDVEERDNQESEAVRASANDVDHLTETAKALKSTLEHLVQEASEAL